MIIHLADVQQPIKVTFEQAKAILCSGLMPNEWTRQNILRCLMC
jgi:hypothetical protein